MIRHGAVALELSGTVDPADVHRSARGDVRVIIRNASHAGRLNLEDVREHARSVAAAGAGIQRHRFHDSTISASSFDQTTTVTFHAS